MWDSLKFLGFIIFCGFREVNCDYISVVGSKTLRIDESYKVAVTSHSSSNRSTNATVTVGIVGQDYDGADYEVYKNVSVGPGATQTVKLKIPNLSPGTFSLVAVSENFSDTVPLYFNTRRVSLLIQINKPVFRTDDSLDFRVFAVNSKTKPYEIKEESKIWILDPGNNQIKVWENPAFEMGLCEGFVNLVDAEPGTWKILVSADGEFASKTFEVRRDTRPMYEIVLTTPSPAVAYRDGSIKIKVKVKVVVKSSIAGNSGFTGILHASCVEQNSKIFREAQVIVDETVLEIDFKNDLMIDEIHDTRKFDLFVDYIDSATNKTYSASIPFSVEVSEFIISNVHSPQYFKPYIPYSFTLLVTHLDGRSVLNSQIPIKVVVTDEDGFLLVQGNYSLDPHTGSAEIDTVGISMTATYLDIKAEYDQVVYEEKVYRSPSSQDDHVSINVLTARPRMYQPVDFQVISTVPVPSVVFQILSKGLLKVSRTIPLENGAANFTIVPKFSYTPKAHCIVFFIRDNGQLVSDSITLHFDNELPNFVNISVESQEASPGSDLTLTVYSTINSTVSLLAIDQRVLSMGCGHEITKDYIFDHELIKYDEIPIELLYDSDIPFWVYQSSYQKMFLDVGAVILTNAKQEIHCESNDITKNPDITEMTTDGLLIDGTYSTSKPVTLPTFIPRRNVNDKFVETFLFETIEVMTPLSENSPIEGAETFTEEIPDTMTSWIISGIAMSKKFGLGLTTSPAVVNAFLYFYIDFVPPDSAKIGEIVRLEFLVVNLFDDNVTAQVTFFNDYHEFNVVRPGSYNWIPQPDGSHSQVVKIQKQSLHRFRIELELTTIGFVDFKISAISAEAGDIVEHQLHVFPEGFPTFENHAEFILVENCDEEGVEVNFTCSLPMEAELETVQVIASVSGDVLGPALANIESLIRLPTGCGEQLMLSFVPNILALDYLLATGQLTDAIADVATEYLEIGYERILEFLHTDGSFSAFGKNEANGSTWLTAYIAKFLRLAQRYIAIEEEVIANALEFVVSKQEADGRFREDGIVFHKEMQGETGSGVAFTAYVAAVIQDDLTNYPQYAINILNADSYVKNNFDPSDVYSLAVATFALYDTNDNHRVNLFKQLHAKAIRTGKHVFWKNHPPTAEISSVDIEITAYALLILDQIPQFYQDAFKVLQWLVSQQNSRGGFQSSQDTVVALQAITKFAAKFSSLKTNLTLDLKPDHGPEFEATINSSTSLITQRFKLQSDVRNLDVKVLGQGYAIVQLSCNFYLNATEESPSFNISIGFRNDSCENKIILEISLSFISENILDTSNMAVVSIDFPSGFVLDSDEAISPEIQKLEEISGGRAVNIYLNSVSTVGSVFYITIRRTEVFYKLAASNVKVYDFYDTSRKASARYKPPKNLPQCSVTETPTLPCVEDFTTVETFPTTPVLPELTSSQSLFSSPLSSLGTAQPSLPSQSESEFESFSPLSEESVSESNPSRSDEFASEPSDEFPPDSNPGPSDEFASESNSGASDESASESNPEPSDEFASESNIAPSDGFASGSNPGPSDEFASESNPAPSDEFASDSNPAPSDEFTSESNPAPSDEFASDSNPAPSNEFASESNPAPSDEFASDSNPAPSDEFASDSNPAPSDEFASESNPAPSDEFASEPNPAPSDEFASESNPAPSGGFASDSNPAPSDEFASESNPGPSDEFASESNPGSSDEFASKSNPGSSDEFASESNPEPSDEFASESNPGPSDEFASESNPEPSDGFASESNPGPSDEITSESNPAPSDQFASESNPTPSEFASDSSSGLSGESSSVSSSGPSNEFASKSILTVSEPSLASSSDFASVSNLIPSNSISNGPRASSGTVSRSSWTPPNESKSEPMIAHPQNSSIHNLLPSTSEGPIAISDFSSSSEKIIPSSSSPSVSSRSVSRTTSVTYTRRSTTTTPEPDYFEHTSAPSGANWAYTPQGTRKKNRRKAKARPTLPANKGYKTT